MRPLAADANDVSHLTPVVCPFCGSSKVTTASEKVDASTYWRCQTCGDMWNVGRLLTSNRNGYKRR
jgi:transposase-like protein